MADLVLDAQIDLEVNEADLQRSVDRAGDIIQDRGERATRPSRGGGGVGIGGVAIGTVIGNMIAGITRIVGRLVRALVNLPRQLMQFAKSLREFSPSMNRVFTVFERRMAMFRRVLGERLAPQVGMILDRIATFLESNEDTISSLLSRILEATLIVSKSVILLAGKLIGEVSDYGQNFRGGMAELGSQLMGWLEGVGVKGFHTPFGEMQTREQMEGRLNRFVLGDKSGGPVSELGSKMAAIQQGIEKLVEAMEGQVELTEQEKLEASNQRLVDMSAQANRFALDPITQFLGAAPDPDARRRNLRDRGIN